MKEIAIGLWLLSILAALAAAWIVDDYAHLKHEWSHERYAFVAAFAVGMVALAPLYLALACFSWNRQRKRRSTSTQEED